MKAAPELRVGLRFRHKDAALLHSLAKRVWSREITKQHAGLFEGAAKAAETGEPLIVRCVNLTEAQLIAQGFVNYGASPPTLEALSGRR